MIYLTPETCGQCLSMIGLNSPVCLVHSQPVMWVNKACIYFVPFIASALDSGDRRRAIDFQLL